jgi:hypothetical protein
MHRPTCARTRAGRLSRLDEDLCLEEAALLARTDGCVVDLGFGATPVTTRELAAALPPHLRVIGVEADPRNVPPNADEGRVSFRVGGFELDPELRPALVVRLMNVLRGYPPGEAAPARARVGAALAEGGVLIEGSCGPHGEVAVAGWWRRRGPDLVPEALLFSTTFANGFAPLVFRDRLPRDARGAVRDGTPLHRFFREWTAAYEEVRPSVPDARGRFVAAAALLSGRRDDVPARPERWETGRLWWRPLPGDVTVGPHVALPSRVQW